MVGNEKGDKCVLSRFGPFARSNRSGATAHRPFPAVISKGRCQMSFMDTLKDKLGMSKGKAGDMMRQHGDKVDQGLDKAGQAVDSKTGGKYSGQVDSGVDKAKDAAHNYGEQQGGGQS